MSQLDTDIVQIAHEIMQYLQRHPNAADSLNGIAQWWLARQRYQNALDKVNLALDLLIKQNYIKRTDNRHGQTIYKFNPGQTSKGTE